MSTTTQNDYKTRYDFITPAELDSGTVKPVIRYTKQELDRAVADARKEGTKAGCQEGREQVISAMLQELDLAKQNKESADDPEDPKVRIKYFEDLLLRFEGATLRKEQV